MIDWSGVDHVLLDMDGTLLDLRYDNTFWLEHLPRVYGERPGLSLAAAQDFILAQTRRHLGTIRFYCMDFWSDTLGLDVAALNAELAHLICMRPYVPEFLDAMRLAGKRTVLVTNAHRSGLEFKLDQTGLAARLDAIVCAHDLGEPKEEQAFWQALQRVEPFDAARSVLVDDNLAVLEAVRRYGVGHLLAVTQPDSSRPPHEVQAFLRLECFSHLLPD